MSHNTTGIKIKTRSRRRSLKPKDPVEVFCRIRPGDEAELEVTEDEHCARCIEHISDTVIQLNPPTSSLAFKAGNKTATQHTFKTVFQDTATQKKLFDHVARPLVYDQLNGRNGLLFTYGITNSGKTYTMCGSNENSGILPRCLDVIFNSVSELLAKPFVFKSDRLNGFNVQSEEDAGKEYRGFRRKKLKGKLEEDSDEPSSPVDRVADESLVAGLDEDNAYAVFVSYFEIYNNYVYDLFEDVQVEGGKTKPPQSKQLREDSKRNMYVSGGVEVEVRNTKDTFSLIEKGQKNRRMAETQLNHNSSRSHAIFNIRVVQAPLDPNGEEVYLDKDKVNVSTLSLVDLAGSERTSRTQADGIQLREAGNINSSLMVLRTCMETLRDNQTSGTSKIVPFRDSKLTHLFKNFFDGEGKVRMIVCVNPRTADYDETIHVLRFSELTQNVVVDRSEGLKVDGLGLAPGRRRANMLYKIQLKELEEVLKESNKEPSRVLLRSVPDKSSSDTPTDTVDPTTSEASSDDAPFRAPPPRIPPKPSRYLANKLLPPLDIEKLLMRNISISEYSKMLQDQVRIKKRIKHELRQKQMILRKRLIDMGEELDTLNSLLSKAKTQVSTKEREMAVTSEKMKRLAKSNDQLQRTNEMLRLNCKELQEETQEKDSKFSQEREKREKLRTFLMNRVTAEKVDWENKLRLKVQKTEEEYMSTIREQANTIQDQQCMLEQLKEIVLDKEEDGLERRYRTPASHRKRPSSDNNKWLQHNPSDSVKVDTLMQPNFKRKKTVQNPSCKSLSGKNIDRYVLTHQEEATDGDVLTHLYKGDVTRTRGGGAAIKFTDVEMLENIDSSAKNPKSVFKVPQTPHTPHPKSRAGNKRYSLALEGHQSGAPPGIINRVV